jgi:hypothetical protein
LLGDKMLEPLKDNRLQFQLGAAWALAWMGEGAWWQMERRLATLNRFYELWATATSQEIRHVLSWAIVSLPLRSHEAWPTNLAGEQRVKALLSSSEEKLSGPERYQVYRELEAALLFCMYTRREIPTRDKLLQLLKSSEVHEKSPSTELLERFLQAENPKTFVPPAPTISGHKPKRKKGLA